MTDMVGLTWELSSVTGWGVYGLNVARHLLQRGAPQPVLLKQPAMLDLEPDLDSLLRPLLKQQQELYAALTTDGPPKPMEMDFPVFQTVLPEFQPMVGARYFYGSPDIAILFFEDTRISAEGLERAKRYPRVVAGSTWNHEILDSWGVEGVRTVLQGVDTRRFRPPDLPHQRGERFTIFSGGKLEHRKGQDIVLAAFRLFRQRHPEAVLLTCWQNPWPEKAADISRSGLVTGAPANREGRLDIESWTQDQGLPAGSVVDLGLVPNHRLPEILHKCDCAVFASRYESGTNLPAMESMACGLPVVLSANTGHLDLVDPKHCYPLTRQTPVPPPQPGVGNEGWGASSPAEIDEALEAIYQQPDEARAKGEAAAEFLQTLSWDHQVERLLEVLDEVS